MEIAQDKIDLISKIIKNDRKFQNNEDLYDDFFNETCRRSVAILDTIDNISTLEAYIRRVATSSIISVLKDSGRLRRSGSRYMSTKEVLVEPKVQENMVDYSSVNISYASLDIPVTPEDNAMQKEVLEFVVEAIKKIDAENTDKRYYDLYALRYDKGLTQKEISEELGVSQSEVSKRIYSLIDKVKEIIEQ